VLPPFAGTLTMVLAVAACRSAGRDSPARSAGASIDRASPTLVDTTVAPTPTIPLQRGLTMVSVLHRAEGDRENTVEVEDATLEGATYRWRYRERQNGELKDGAFERFVRAADLATAPGMHTGFQPGEGRQEVPGYTAFSLSRGIYHRAESDGSTPFTMMLLDEVVGGSGVSRQGSSSLMPFRGTLAPVSVAPEPMSLLVNGRRSWVRTHHLVARLVYEKRAAEVHLWVLADSAHPLVLKTTVGARRFQMIRVDLPGDRGVEADLARSCRAELPGIYFAFASAALEPASEAALNEVGALLGRHPDWTLTVEGHTDSVGDAAANQQLSIERAESVRAALVEGQGIAASRLIATGFGATRARETNATLEGRARNRRVELVRQCSAD
jgi:outer membrane protein OmpA-like peptidoglycan-associated protein